MPAHHIDGYTEFVNVPQQRGRLSRWMPDDEARSVPAPNRRDRNDDKSTTEYVWPAFPPQSLQCSREVSPWQRRTVGDTYLMEYSERGAICGNIENISSIRASSRLVLTVDIQQNVRRITSGVADRRLS